VAIGRGPKPLAGVGALPNARGVKDRSNRILAVVVVVAVAVVVVVVWLSASRTRTEFAAGTPERTVQSYVVAVTRHDAVEASRYLDQSSGCDVTDLEQTGVPEGLRVTLVDSTVTGAKASVSVRMSSDAAPLGGAGATETHLFQLARPGQEWLISGTPWPLFTCEGVQK
jgi:hypothetical protein